MNESTNNFNISNFDGPLDLLLSLVKDKEIDIMNINLLELASSYLELIHSLKDQDIDLASEYLVMAATLLQIKARSLLSTPGEEDAEVEESKDELLRKLAEYQQFKAISKELRIKEELRKNIFIKGVGDYSDFKYEEDETKLDGKSDAIKLIITLRKMFERVYAQRFREATIEKINLSPAERRLEIIEILNKNPHPTFEMLFAVPTIEHFVITLVTILDMNRKQEIKLNQEEQYGRITFTKGVINE